MVPTLILFIDCCAAWMGNELVGRRGVLINPAPHIWWLQQSGEPIEARGDWSKICLRAFQSAKVLAERQHAPLRVHVSKSYNYIFWPSM